MIPPAFSSLSTRRLNTIRTAIEAAPDYPDAARAILTLGAKWTPDALGKLLGDGLELAALHGREAAFTDGEDDDARFADADVFNQPFKEQIDFFTQKRGKPTKAWTDALRGTHDRAFVIAGATDLAMPSDFQTAIASAMQNGTTFADFQKDFDRIVAKYGWAYKGESGWRSRVIFETNLRTSHMAGRLKQMRDPDVLKLRPYWEYRHGETRKPKIPRTQHLAWHGKCYPHDDPFWQTHFPPNDWHCSCGVRSRYMPETADDAALANDVWGDDAILAYVPEAGDNFQVPSFAYDQPFGRCHDPQKTYDLFQRHHHSGYGRR
ncbi:phage minor head protein [Agrobacterium vitis]